MARKRLGEILIQAGVLNESQLRTALSEQRRWGGPLGRILIDMKLINEDTMVQAISHQLNFPVVNLDEVKIEDSVVDLISGELAEQHSVVPFTLQGKFLDVAMSDPTNLGIIDELRIRTRLNVRPYLAGPKMIERALARWYGRGMATINLGTDGRIGAVAPGDPDASAPLNMRFVDAQAPAHPGSVPPGIATAAAGGVSQAAAKRAQTFEFTDTTASGVGAAGGVPGGPGVAVAGVNPREVAALQARVQQLEALVARDEDVLRKLLGLFIEKGLATREEILERIK